MREWSTYCQNADLLEKSRMMIMNRNMSSQVASWIGLKPGDSVLDVGCGSGELTFYLAEATEKISYTGVDLDIPLLERAESKVGAYSGSCEISFIRGNALELPFADGSFDVVVSQTLFTSISDYEKVLQEMRRVCRPGGRIASLNPLNFNTVYQHPGNYPVDATWVASYQQSLGKMMHLYNVYGTVDQHITGIVPMKMPEMFARGGLQNVSAYPIGTFLSLSNDVMTKDDKRRYIMLDYQSEIDKFNAHMRLPGAYDLISEDEVQQIVEAFSQRRDYLLAHLDDNKTWEWMGTTFLLVVGEHSSKNDGVSDEVYLMDELRAETDTYKKVLAKLDIETEENWHHSGAGRTAAVRVSIAGTDISALGVGITPVHAITHGYRTLLGLLETGAYDIYDTGLWDDGQQLPVGPDVQLLTAKELEQSCGLLLEETLLHASKGPGAPIIDFRTAAQKLNGWEFASGDGKYASLPFKRLGDATIEWLPDVLCRAYYGSNGIGVGVTQQAAMVNGLCSIAESYAARKILLEGQTPPLLPEEIVYTLPEALQEAVCALQYSKTYRLRLMDASCGIGLPVVAAMLIDQRHGKAIVRFGAHPKMEEALAHCIAGLIAEQKYEGYGKMMSIAMTDEKVIDYPRRFNLMEDAFDMYPGSLLASTSSWEYSPWSEVADDIAGQLEQLTVLYRKLDWDIYVRRCDFLGVPAVQIVIPGVSMLHDFGTIRMQERRMGESVKPSFRNMASVNPDEQKRAVQYARMKMGWRAESGFAQLSGIAYTPIVLGLPLDAGIIYGLMKLHDGEYDEALGVFKYYSYDSLGNLSAVQALSEMVRAVKNGVAPEYLKEQLSVIYPESWMKEVITILNNPLGALPTLSCPNCQNCRIQQKCNMAQTVQIMQRVREQMKNA